MQNEVIIGKPEEKESEGFDIRVHYVDGATRKVTHKNPYRMHVVKGVQYFERPVGSLNLFYKDGSPAGRLDEKALAKNKMEVLVGAAHVEWVAPKSESELREMEYQAAIKKSAALEKELAAMKAEQEKKDGIASKDVSSAKPRRSGNGSADKLDNA